MKYFKYYYFLLILMANVRTNPLNDFLKTFKVEIYSTNINICKHQNELVIYNGENQLGLFKDEKYSFYNIIFNQEGSLFKILINDNYIFMFFNIFNDPYNKLSTYFIINKHNKKITQYFYEQPIIGAYFLKDNIIMMDIFNKMILYNENLNILWQQDYNYSKIINYKSNNLLFDEKYNNIYWLFNDDIIYILDPNTGNLKDTITVHDETIINLMIHEDQLIIITHNSIFIYGLEYFNLIKTLENVYPISKGVIFKNILYFHDNKTLYEMDLETFNLQKYIIKPEDEPLNLMEIIPLEEGIIIPTETRKWFFFKDHKIIIKKSWKLLSKIQPIQYNNKIIFYKNFSSYNFESLSFEELLKL